MNSLVSVALVSIFFLLASVSAPSTWPTGQSHAFFPLSEDDDALDCTCTRDTAPPDDQGSLVQLVLPRVGGGNGPIVLGPNGSGFRFGQIEPGRQGQCAREYVCSGQTCIWSGTMEIVNSDIDPINIEFRDNGPNGPQLPGVQGGQVPAAANGANGTKIFAFTFQAHCDTAHDIFVVAKKGNVVVGNATIRMDCIKCSAT